MTARVALLLSALFFVLGVLSVIKSYELRDQAWRALVPGVVVEKLSCA